MKQCPVCKTNYTDDSLQFCLADGANLSFANTEQVTEQFHAANNPIRVNIAQDTLPNAQAQTSNQTVLRTMPEKKGGNGLVIGLLVAVLALIVLGGAILTGWFLLKDRGGEVVANKNINTTPTQTPDETANLKEKLANLEKKIQEQKNQKQTVPTITNSSTTQSTKVTAKVNSPGDGFLALRTEPSAETGDRILQIPHGSIVKVLGCLPKAPGKKGRWCRVDFDGNLGWAFDGFLIY